MRTRDADKEKLVKEKAIEMLRRGIDVSLAHGHPSMANEYKMTIDLDYGE